MGRAFVGVRRTTLKNFIEVDVHKLVNEVSFWDRQIGKTHVSLMPDRWGTNYFLQLFVNSIRVDKTFELSSRPHHGSDGDLVDIWSVLVFLNFSLARSGEKFLQGRSAAFRSPGATVRPPMKWARSRAARCRPGRARRCRRRTFGVGGAYGERPPPWAGPTSLRS